MRLKYVISGSKIKFNASPHLIPRVEISQVLASPAETSTFCSPAFLYSAQNATLNIQQPFKQISQLRSFQ